MSNETSSINQPMSMVQKSRSVFGDIADYLQTRMDDYPNTSSFRITVYLLEGVLIGLFTYLKIPINDVGEQRSDSFSVPLKDGVRKIAFIDLYFIAVEDHYCKFVFNSNGEIYNEYVRLSLKEAWLASRPAILLKFIAPMLSICSM